MIVKKPGKIGDLVHEFTIYNHDMNRRHIDFTELKMLIEKIIETGEIAEIVITPIYSNYKLNFSIVWYEEDFSISMSDSNQISTLDIEQEISDIREKKYSDMTDEQKHVSTKTVKLIPKEDLKMFHQYLLEYIEFLNNRIEIYFKEVLKIIEQKHQNDIVGLAFGSFGFEVLSNNLES